MTSVFNRFNFRGYQLKVACYRFMISSSSSSDAAVCAISSAYALCSRDCLGCGHFSDHQVHAHDDA